MKDYNAFYREQALPYTHEVYTVKTVVNGKSYRGQITAKTAKQAKAMFIAKVLRDLEIPESRMGLEIFKAAPHTTVHVYTAEKKPLPKVKPTLKQTDFNL